MKKLAPFLRPYAGAIALVFLLLFGQAMANLALPGYMSDIINIGVQQSGITDVVPRAIRASEMSRLELFMTDSDKAIIAQDYTLLDRATLTSQQYDQYVKEYPVLATEPVYILGKITSTDNNNLNDIFGKPELAVATIETQGAAAFSSVGITIPTGEDPFQFLGQLSPDQLAQARQTIDQVLGSLPESMVLQSAATYLTGEYKAIGIDVGSIQAAYMIRIGLIMLGIALAGALLAIAVGYLAARVAAGFSRDVRQHLFNKVESFSSIEFDKFSTASLITRTTNDVQQVQMLAVVLLRIVFFAPIMGIGGIILAVGEDPSMSWIIAAAVLALMVMIGIVFTIAMPKFRLVQKLVDRLNLVTREILTGLMVVRAFNRQPYEEEKFDLANIDVTRVNLFINRVMVVMMPAMMFLLNGVTVLIVWIGAHQVDAGNLQVGNMIAFMQYALQIIFSFLMISIVFIMLPRAGVSAGRIAEVISTRLSIVDPEIPENFPAGIHGYVEFRDVGFKYPNAEDYVLRNISFTARPGQTTAVVGSTGSGKSTLINLIPRFYDVTEGSIMVDETDIRNVTQNELRSKIGYVPQRATLFSGTIQANIKYGNEHAVDSEIEKAAVAAQAADFIAEAEEGFQTHVAEAASNLSGGQKQRLAIARAIIKRPEIYIFDDSFSAIDYKTDAALRRALLKETVGATVLIVAQRISTIMHADQIIVLDKGRLAGIGTHRELIESNDVYRELALSQLSKEELSL